MTMDHARNYLNLSCMALQIPHQNGILRHTPLENTCSRGISSPLQPPFKQHQRHYKAVGCSWSTWEPSMNIYWYIILLYRYDICILYPIIGHMWASVVVMFFRIVGMVCGRSSCPKRLQQNASAEHERLRCDRVKQWSFQGLVWSKI